LPWFAVLLAVHVGLAVTLLVPSLALPFLLRAPSRAGRRRAVGMLLALQGGGSVAVAIGLAITGSGLLVIVGPELLRRPWLLAALTIYGLNLLLAAFVARPGLRRLVARGADADEETWSRRARTQRTIAYLMAGATGLIGFLMSAKPDL